MKDWWNKKYAIIAFYAFMVLASVVLFVNVLSSLPWFLSTCTSFLSFIKAFIIGFVIAYLINPSYTFFREKVYGKMFAHSKLKRITKGMSIFTVYILALGIFAFLLWIVIPQFISGITEFINNFNDYYNSFNDLLNKLTHTNETVKSIVEELSNKMMDYLKGLQLSDFAQLKNITVSITSAIASLFTFSMGFIISIYMLYNKEMFCAQIKKAGYAIFSNKFMQKLQRLFGKSNIAFGQYLTGVLIDALIVGIICFITMQVANVPYAVLIGVIVGITNMIPFFGPFIGAVPSVILVLMVKPSMAIWCVVILVVLQQIDGNFISPKIVGQKTGLSAIWVIFAILVGGGFFGIIGMLIAVPLFSIIYYLIKNTINRRLAQKNLSSNTIDYYANPQDKKDDKESKKM